MLWQVLERKKLKTFLPGVSVSGKKRKFHRNKSRAVLGCRTEKGLGILG